ncbi:hypothetical protein [Methylotenera sp.]|nr:hypothetical protein [Methylotenera sp.]MDI1360429.1 hypothetical protein [Methylotenera sp.]
MNEAETRAEHIDPAIKAAGRSPKVRSINTSQISNRLLLILF